MMKIDPKVWPVQGNIQQIKRQRVLRKGKEIFKKYVDEENRNELINQFNNIESKQSKYGLSNNRIQQFISGDVKGRIGEAKDWHKHWLMSIENYERKKQKKGMLKNEENEENEKEEEEEEEEEEEIIVDVDEDNEETFDRRELKFEERIELIMKFIGKEIRFINKNKRQINDTYYQCIEIIKDFQIRVNRWEGRKITKEDIIKDDINSKRIKEILQLSEIESNRKRIINILEKEAKDIQREEILRLIEIIIFGGKCSKEEIILLDEVIFEKLIDKCFQIQGLEDIGLILFKLGVACGKHSSSSSNTKLMEYSTDEIYETASLIQTLLNNYNNKFKAEPLKKLHQIKMITNFKGEKLIDVGARVCKYLLKLNRGEEMLWASHVVRAEAEVAQPSTDAHADAHADDACPDDRRIG